MSRELPARPSLEQLRKQAKELQRQTPHETLAAAQFALARDYGFDSWAELRQHVEAIAPGLAQFEQLAHDLADAYTAGNSHAVREINWSYGTGFPYDNDHTPEKMHRHLATWYATPDRPFDLALADTRQMIAHDYDYPSWHDFRASFRARSAATPAARPQLYRIDWHDNRLHAHGPLGEADWERIAAVMREHGLTKLSAGGITDAALPLLAHLPLTHLAIESPGLTDTGAQHLAHLGQLQDLELGGWKSPLTDRAFAPLARLPNLRRVQACWTQGLTDEAAHPLAACPQLVDVNFMGTRLGDGLVRHLAGQPHLQRLSTGAGLTDAGLDLLHEIPAFRIWPGGEPDYGLMTFRAGPTFLLLDGQITNHGLARLKGLDGLFGLSFFRHCPAIGSEGLPHLRELARLGFLGLQDQRCDDGALRQLGQFPQLRMLMGQGAVATDDGWAALSRSTSLEYLWGRECPNFRSRGFRALAQMPSLRGLAINGAQVDADSWAMLPQFPALRDVCPMGASDAAFEPIGRCRQLEQLWCMYCRDTGDAATSHLTGLSQLKNYYAGRTQITDRSLHTLASLPSLERVELWQCAGVTDAGIAELARLPRLRELILDGLPQVTSAVAGLFPPPIRLRRSG